MEALPIVAVNREADGLRKIRTSLARGLKSKSFAQECGDATRDRAVSDYQPKHLAG